MFKETNTYIQASNISHTSVGNKIVDHSNVITCRHCSNYIFILNLTPDFNGLDKDNCKMRWETCKFWNLVLLVLEVLWYLLTMFVKHHVFQYILECLKYINIWSIVL